MKAQAMKAPQKSTVTLPNDRDVVVVRAFNAPRDLVFDAWTKPELVQRWLLGPPGWTMPVCEMDVRVGGKYRWRWRSEKNGNEFGFSGEFREVVRPSRIVHVERYDPGDVGGEMGEALVTTELTEKERRNDAHDDDSLRIERGARRGGEDRHDRRHGDGLPEARRPARRATGLRSPVRRCSAARRGSRSNARPAAVSV